MDSSQLPDVDELLVTADHPALSPSPGMDHARCAALHNYLVRYAWLAERRSPASLQANNNFFTTYGDSAEALRPRLSPSVAAFLDAAIIPSPAVDGDGDDDPSPAPFFWWVSALSEPDFLFDDEAADLYDQPPDSLVCLYSPNTGQGGESGGGLFYHQRHHRAAVFMHMDDHDHALPVDAHPELWHPLETLLSHWVGLIRLGKVAASPRRAPALFGSEKIGPWEWRPYGDAQVATCVAAWHRLCDAIEAPRASPSLAHQHASVFEPLLPPAALDAASVPEGCFARAFLSRARRPRFRRVAPGLVLPPTDPGEFAQAQPYTGRPREGPHVIPPVRLFFCTEPHREAHLASSPFRDGFAALSRVPAGVYTESVARDAYDNAEEGFRLLLPYGLEGDVGRGDAAGARRSDGSFLEPGVAGAGAVDLFQHGYKPFGGDYYRPQRLERLFDRWRELVDQGVWPVGPEGVMGTIEEFKKADTTRWRDYCIPPTW